MDTRMLARLDRRVPRYTSYPTAPHFGAGVDSALYGRWLAELPPGEALSLYLHIPFCDSLCWFCGCNTSVVNSHRPVAAYLDDLACEIALVADTLGGRRPVAHLHFGGGSPSMLRPEDIARLGGLLHDRFAIASDAEIAVEFDPRGLDEATVAAFAAIGVNRASLGLQDINPAVQQAINRIQPPESNRRAVAMLRDAGIGALNLDLVYGLPWQDEAGVAATVDHACSLAPDRIALFGYAHVPQMKRHQKLIPEAALPGSDMRLRQASLAADRLQQAGYRRIGLDHFVLPGDAMAAAADNGTLRRNFQGYSADPAATLIGLGASSIGALPQGYVQNASDVPGWRAAVRAGNLPVARGIALDADDRLRRAVIDALMCFLEADVAAIATRHGSTETFAAELSALEPYRAMGMVTLDGGHVRVSERGRPFVRLIAAAFDAWLDAEASRHSRAV